MSITPVKNLCGDRIFGNAGKSGKNYTSFTFFVKKFGRVVSFRQVSGNGSNIKFDDRKTVVSKAKSRSSGELKGDIPRENGAFSDIFDLEDFMEAFEAALDEDEKKYRNFSFDYTSYEADILDPDDVANAKTFTQSQDAVELVNFLGFSTQTEDLNGDMPVNLASSEDTVSSETSGATLETNINVNPASSEDNSPLITYTEKDPEETEVSDLQEASGEDLDRFDDLNSGMNRELMTLKEDLSLFEQEASSFQASLDSVKELVKSENRQQASEEKESAPLFLADAKQRPIIEQVGSSEQILEVNGFDNIEEGTESAGILEIVKTVEAIERSENLEGRDTTEQQRALKNDDNDNLEESNCTNFVEMDNVRISEKDLELNELEETSNVEAFLSEEFQAVENEGDIENAAEEEAFAPENSEIISEGFSLQEIESTAPEAPANSGERDRGSEADFSESYSRDKHGIGALNFKSSVEKTYSKEELIVMTVLAFSLAKSGLSAKDACWSALRAPFVVENIVSRVHQRMATDRLFLSPSESSKLDHSLSNNEQINESESNRRGETIEEVLMAVCSHLEGKQALIGAESPRELQKIILRSLTLFRDVRVEKRESASEIWVELGPENEGKWMEEASNFLLGDKMSIACAYLEGLGVRDSQVKRVAQFSADQSLPAIHEKVEWMRAVMRDMERPNEKISEALSRFLAYFELPIKDEPLQKTFSFIQKLEAQNGGKVQLDSIRTAVPRLLEGFPQILGPVPLRQLSECVDHMCSEWALPRGHVARVILCFPSVLFLSVDRDLTPKKLTLKQIGIRVGDMGRMVAKYPWLLSPTILDNIPPVQDFLVAQNVPLRYVERVFRQYPSLLGCRPQQRFFHSLQYFIALGFQRKHLVFMLKHRAMLLTRTPAQHETVEKYLLGLGLAQEDVLYVAKTCPEVFAYRVSMLQPKIDFLLRLNISRDLVPRILRLNPKILDFSVATLQERFVFFRKRGISHQDVVKMILKFPQLLRYGIESVVEPKLNFLEREMGRGLDELVEYPKFVSFSLEGRIVRRNRTLTRQNIHLDLQSMLECSDERFAETYLGLGKVFISIKE